MLISVDICKEMLSTLLKNIMYICIVLVLQWNKIIVMKRECGLNPQQYPLLWCPIVKRWWLFELPATVIIKIMGRLQKTGISQKTCQKQTNSELSGRKARIALWILFTIPLVSFAYISEFEWFIFWPRENEQFFW